VEFGIMVKNAIINEIFINNIKAYEIRPKKGYKLHEKSRDEFVVDESGSETGKIILGYTEEVITASGSYDFEKNPREIYAVEV
jgi:hypothetical protein